MDANYGYAPLPMLEIERVLGLDASDAQAGLSSATEMGKNYWANRDAAKAKDAADKDADAKAQAATSLDRAATAPSVPAEGA